MANDERDYKAELLELYRSVPSIVSTHTEDCAFSVSADEPCTCDFSLEDYWKSVGWDQGTLDQAVATNVLVDAGINPFRKIAHA